ncbi:hypothetical protein ACVILK_006868 [Bradyrhizobium embrapense]
MLCGGDFKSNRNTSQLFELLALRAKESKILLQQVLAADGKWEDSGMTGLAVMENVRRYRAIALLCRQTAAFRPVQRCSLLTQAKEWERRAVVELEGYFDLPVADEAARIP